MASQFGECSLPTGSTTNLRRITPRLKSFMPRSGIRITSNVYTTLGELDRFCEQMELIARNGLPS